MSIILFTSLVMMLSSCDLAIEDEYYENEPSGDAYYIPSGIEFKIYQGNDQTNELDVSENFYVSFSCPGRTVWADCIWFDIGQSIESEGADILTEHSTINGDEQTDVHTVSFDLTFYALKDNDLTLYSTFLMENETGDIRKENQMEVDFTKRLTTSGEVMGEKPDGTLHVVEYAFNYEPIDKLELVTIKQFDKDDTLLVETAIPKEDLLDSITLNPDTEYYFIIEEYVDSEGTDYQERLYRDDFSSPSNYLYKYTNDHGFLNGDRLYID